MKSPDSRSHASHRRARLCNTGAGLIDSVLDRCRRLTIYRDLTKLCGGLMGARDTVIEEYAAQLQACMYQYSRAIYRSIKDLIDPYVAPELHLEYRRAVLEQCEQTMERLARDPLYFAKPDRALFQDIRRYFPITAQAQVAWAVQEGVAAAAAFIEEQIEAGARAGRGAGRSARGG